MKDYDTLIDPTTTSHFVATESFSPTLTILAGTDVGRVFSLGPGPAVIGRSPQSEVHIAHESISRQHCEITVNAKNRVTLTDLGSTNGTRVNDGEIPKGAFELRGGERIRLSKKVVLKFAFQDNLEKGVQEDLYSSAVRDPLTGIHNKRFFQERLDHEVAYASRHNANLSLMMFDLDHFKKVNDTYGHPAGDAVLVEVARRVHNALRNEDVFARYGGEEFVVIMRSTPIAEAERAAARVLHAIRERPVRFNQIEIPLTVSIGVAGFQTEQPSSPSAFLARADLLLYQAKERGRDCLVSSATSEEG